MPLIQVTMLEGRAPEQKRRLAERITAVVSEELGAKPEFVVITMVDVPKSNYAQGGVLAMDKAPAKT